MFRKEHQLNWNAVQVVSQLKVLVLSFRISYYSNGNERVSVTLYLNACCSYSIRILVDQTH